MGDLFGNASNIILTVAALLAVIGGAFKFFLPQMRSALGIVDLSDPEDEEDVPILPRDVMAKVDLVLENQLIFGEALMNMLPPDNEQVQDALNVLHRAGLVDTEVQEDRS